MSNKFWHGIQKLLPWNWFRKPRAVSLILQDKKGNLLLLQRSPFKSYAKGKWETAGGEVFIGESFENAIKRVMLNQLGLNLVNYELVHQNEFSPNELGLQYFVKVFKVSYNGVPKIQDLKDSIRLKWVSPLSLKYYNFTTYTKQDFIYMGLL